MSLRNMEVQYVGDTLYLPPLEREVKHIIVKDEDVKDWKHFEPKRTCIMSVIADWEYGDGEEDWELLCSNCGDKKWYRMGEHPDYCPKCGARVKCEWES